MKLRTNILLALTLCSAVASAQHLTLDMHAPSVTIRQDSVVVELKMAVSCPDMESKGYIRLTPFVSGGNRSVSLPQILLNGERAHKTYRRTQALNRRKGKTDTSAVFTAIILGESKQDIDYRVSVPASSWPQSASLSFRKEVFGGSGEKVQNEVIPIPAGGASAPADRPDVWNASSASGYAYAPAVSASPASPLVSASPTVSQEYHSDVPASSAGTVGVAAPSRQSFKGSYISPESDATDERNQKELNFSLDEARVIAEVNPQMLSLRELYTVAISYKNDPVQFYRIIDTSVKIYPASPVANLNAAAAAIERGNAQAAGRYLQMASHDNLAYKNCRGAYELMCNNTYEGIRLLKAAKAEGSEEATYNLKIFFESKQTAVPIQ
ncbi:MAG: DUF3868 domain-containing protein [Bacteroides sp.]|nr:DUF3868 domain-containing protein [Bacteroides sp.]